jgi:hypothetical protein
MADVKLSVFLVSAYPNASLMIGPFEPKSQLGKTAKMTTKPKFVGSSQPMMLARFSNNTTLHL